MRLSLRLKVALGFSVLTVALLAAQAMGVRLFAEVHEEKLIDALIHDDMESVLQSYEAAPETAPPFDPRLQAYVSATGKPPVVLPAGVAGLSYGPHEIIVDGREIHVAVAPFKGRRLYRVYNFSVYERSFKEIVNALMAAMGILAIFAVWLAFGLTGLLMRQVASLTRQVNQLRSGAAAAIDPGRFDEIELIGLVDTFNGYHQRMAEMIAREKDFTGNVSHELRTPLTAIKTSCELLGQTAGLDDKTRARVARIEGAADRMHDLVDALLLLAREQAPAEAAAVRLASLAGEVLQPFEAALAAKGIARIVDIEPGAEVAVNEAALRMVLSNLIDNAVRYTDSGHLRLAWADGTLCVEDTGHGIGPQALPHVFERFYRDRETASAVQGFGIGLAVVRKLCSHYGWPIAIASEAGRGTRVSLRLRAS